MRMLLLAMMLAPMLSTAQDPEAFERALKSGHVERVDRFVKHELHRQRKGQLVTTPSTSYIVHGPTFDTLVAFLRAQTGVLDAAWDKCLSKEAIWPGHSRIGVRFEMNGAVHERCYSVQEGRPGQIMLFGWRPKVRKDRAYLRYKGVSACTGFVEQQRKYCAERRCSLRFPRMVPPNELHIKLLRICFNARS